MKPEVMPCPFCGKVPGWHFEHLSVDRCNTNFDRVGVQSIGISLSCGCKLSPRSTAEADLDDGKHMSERWFPDALALEVNKVVDLWNTRVHIGK